MPFFLSDGSIHPAYLYGESVGVAVGRNAGELERLAVLFREAQGEALERGFFGEIKVVVKVQDGVIQKESKVQVLRDRR